tara:strand:- start:1393 stop:2841 length:1449 start_codon:yes stop_codon:yes gene_type:complete
MSSISILILIILYFALLLLISFLTKSDGNNSFFSANKKSPWFIVAFGMIGASLSGVTFISVPGWVEVSKFSYLQMVLGYTIGYFIIGTVLLPLYYKMNLTSIYTYLDFRFGPQSYLTGAGFFLLSRIVGASFRLYLVANVLQLLVFNSIGVPFWITVTITIFLIWIYTFKSGIKTIVWTDTIQTFFMLLAVIFSINELGTLMNLNLSTFIPEIINSSDTKIFFFDDYNSANYFWKQFFSGIFIAIVMTGLDQDMMQKNLTCRSLKDAQKNMFWFTIVLVIVNTLFMILGYLLTQFADIKGIDAQKDTLFPTIANLPEMGVFVSAMFILGLIAAAYSSADSALTSMTTSVCIDLLKIEKIKSPRKQIVIRKQAHFLLSIVLIFVILIFKYVIANESVIAKLFLFAGYTYGPLLGLYSFGLLTKWKIKDKWAATVCVISPFIGYTITESLKTNIEFDLGFMILVINGVITFIGLFFIKKKYLPN